jgi:hypothetical protein
MAGIESDGALEIALIFAEILLIDLQNVYVYEFFRYISAYV